MQNGHVENFNGRMRDECLNASWFRNLADARDKISRWREESTASDPTAVWAILPWVIEHVAAVRSEGDGQAQLLCGLDKGARLISRGRRQHEKFLFGRRRS